MPNRDEHLRIAGTTAATFNAVVDVVSQLREMKTNPGQRFNVGRLAVRTAGSYYLGQLGGILPDEIEPAYHPNHRGIAHSKLALTAVGARIAYTLENNQPFVWMERAVHVGYFSHLEADSRTPKGLPTTGIKFT